MTSGKVWSTEEFPLVEEAQIRDHLYKLDVCKSMTSLEMYP